MRLRFIAIFTSMRKHKEQEEKKQGKIKTLAARISEIAGAIAFLFGM